MASNYSSGCPFRKNNVSNFKEWFFNFWIFIIKISSSYYISSAFKGLYLKQNFFSKSSSFCIKFLFIKMNNKIILFTVYLKTKEILLLILQQIHCINKCSLSMSLTPLFRFSVIQGKSNYSFSDLLHDWNPEILLLIILCKTEYFIDFWETW